MNVTSEDLRDEWWLHAKRNLMKERHLEGKLSVAGYNPLPEQIPEDVLEMTPQAPLLGKIVIVVGNSSHVSCPEAVVKDWHHHPVFGVRFRAFLDAFHDRWKCNQADEIDICGDVDEIGHQTVDGLLIIANLTLILRTLQL